MAKEFSICVLVRYYHRSQINQGAYIVTDQKRPTECQYLGLLALSIRRLKVAEEHDSRHKGGVGARVHVRVAAGCCLPAP